MKQNIVILLRFPPFYFAVTSRPKCNSLIQFNSLLSQNTRSLVHEVQYDYKLYKLQWLTGEGHKIGEAKKQKTKKKQKKKKKKRGKKKKKGDKNARDTKKKCQYK